MFVGEADFVRGFEEEGGMSNSCDEIAWELVASSIKTAYLSKRRYHLGPSRLPIMVDKGSSGFYSYRQWPLTNSSTKPTGKHS
jgi:hypothetical protein